MKKAITITLIASLALAGCATNQRGYQGSGTGWEPVIDIRPEQQASYPSDLTACQQHASKVMDAQQAAMQGAVAGAIFGALLGAAAGGHSRFNSRMAGVGALTAGATAGANQEMNVRSITRNCMIGRGYNVLN